MWTKSLMDDLLPPRVTLWGGGLLRSRPARNLEEKSSLHPALGSILTTGSGSGSPPRPQDNAPPVQTPHPPPRPLSLPRSSELDAAGTSPSPHEMVLLPSRLSPHPTPPLRSRLAAGRACRGRRGPAKRNTLGGEGRPSNALGCQGQSKTEPQAGTFCGARARKGPPRQSTKPLPLPVLPGAEGGAQLPFPIVDFRVPFRDGHFAAGERGSSLHPPSSARHGLPLFASLCPPHRKHHLLSYTRRRGFKKKPLPFLHHKSQHIPAK